MVEGTGVASFRNEKIVMDMVIVFKYFKSRWVN